jgi:hypothetical protein
MKIGCEQYTRHQDSGKYVFVIEKKEGRKWHAAYAVYAYTTLYKIDCINSTAFYLIYMNVCPPSPPPTHPCTPHPIPIYRRVSALLRFVFTPSSQEYTACTRS